MIVSLPLLMITITAAALLLAKLRKYSNSLIYQIMMIHYIIFNKIKNSNSKKIMKKKMRE